MKKKAKKTSTTKGRRKASVKDLPAKKAGSVKGGVSITGGDRYFKDQGP
jgi:hypothetical protein